MHDESSEIHETSVTDKSIISLATLSHVEGEDISPINQSKNVIDVDSNSQFATITPPKVLGSLTVSQMISTPL